MNDKYECFKKSPTRTLPFDSKIWISQFLIVTEKNYERKMIVLHLIEEHTRELTRSLVTICL